MEPPRTRLVVSRRPADGKVFTEAGPTDPPLGPAERCTGLLFYPRRGR
ncbi:hypothetical protein LRS74_00585 [Streptomyces sp. LX-29]|nr:hypothetical protein [Streptomyces sp. LX-29]WFB05675.1 hypothetical protein LRS74_00585 [Streptomyces sp. LX-29]